MNPKRLRPTLAPTPRAHSETGTRDRQEDKKRARVTGNLKQEISNNNLHTDDWIEWIREDKIPYMIDGMPLWFFARLAGNLNVYAIDLYRRCESYTLNADEYPGLAGLIQLGYGPAVTHDGRRLVDIPFDQRIYSPYAYNTAMDYARHT